MDTCTSGTQRRGDRAIGPYDYVSGGDTSEKVGCNICSSAPTSRRLNVVCGPRPSIREVGRNGETTTPKGPTIRSPTNRLEYKYSFVPFKGSPN